ncbi:phycobilisome rod-core linker polypeptide [Oscillatoria sp. FACHB-1407]|uniref:phycobilisome rod-core linker polypeptide n=1 Tax=Oscillatoria sp. FACHB-1407 TaxID=2692847 RepID=UPI0016834DDA|nr:phycobilisome rod-core linker polypeptide [Oscillatoria sp. FACHB-1407]MBD2464917.1 phycobilisome rod-core linker polypeptide [Oscillatoria sp. FACHB-1407]
MLDFTPVTVNRHSSLEERQFALTQIYRQVLERQPYESERKTIASLEKDFLKDKIGVRRFLKQFACTDIYLNQFYYSLSNVKFMDVCFKHFLGRAISDHQEMKFYNTILTKQGVHGLITAILDSEEYRKTFGCFTVPYPRKDNFYPSPEAFLESKFLNEEHIGQRGNSIPTMYWRQLGWTCTNGVCRHPEVNEVLNTAPKTTSKEIQSLSTNDLLELLKTSDVTTAKAIVANLSSSQRQELSVALRH